MKFLLKPHRLSAILLGVIFLIFTQLVVFKPFEKQNREISPSAVTTVKTLSEVKPQTPIQLPLQTDIPSNFEADDFQDLIEALDRMDEEDIFSEFKDPLASLPQSISTMPKIAIVIDDMGMNKEQSWAAIELNFPLTLSFLPYATQIQEMADKGKSNGHDIMLHIPMQPLDTKVNAGENILEMGVSEEILIERLEQNFLALNSYVGINNHMGSAFTQDENGMNILMSYLQGKNIFFLDSRTTAESVAENTAKTHEVNFLSRDVFLDHEETYEYTKEALERLERIALENGSAIAIGHPKELTLNTIKKWASTLEAKNIELVNLSDLMN